MKDPDENKSGLIHQHYLINFLYTVGKSTLFECLKYRDIPIPEHIDIYLLSEEIGKSNKTAIECVMEVDDERIRLEREADELTATLQNGNDSAHDRLTEIYERLDELDADKAEVNFKKSLSAK